MAETSWTMLETPIGRLKITASEKGITSVGISEEEGTHLEGTSGELVEKGKQELEEYFQGKRKTFDLPLQMEGTDYEKKVWQQLMRIPYGETRTYRETAAACGNDKASRAVGSANHHNRILILIPCHRVISSDGSLGGYAAGLEAKKYLLEMEKKYSQ